MLSVVSSSQKQKSVTEVSRSITNSRLSSLTIIGFGFEIMCAMLDKRKFQNVGERAKLLVKSSRVQDQKVLTIPPSSGIFSGSRSGAIHHHDVRVASHHVGSLLGHSQEVCGMQWSPDGKLLASGGNDNVLNIWAQGGTSDDAASPLHTLTHHQAAVKVMYEHN